VATRYWVGGSGNWDATSTANWSATSGGAAGASAPTSADNVIFDVNSNVGTGAFTVTVDGATATPSICNDITASGLDGAMTLAFGTTGVLDCYGSLTFPATNLTVTSSAGTINFQATTTGKTITTNGVSISTAFVFLGSGGEWTLGSAVSGNGSISFRNGTLNTNNFNITLNALGSGTIANTRTLSLGSSIITLAGATPVNMVTPAGLTLNAGTSTIQCSNATPTFSGGGLTFYNVAFTSGSLAGAIITGENTYNNLTIPSRTGNPVVTTFGSNQTINGTLTIGTTNGPANRQIVASSAVGVQRTLTVNTMATLSDVDFRDIAIAGNAISGGNVTGTRLGNGGNNANITFDAPKTVYWNLAAGGNWFSTVAPGWALTSGGAVNTNNIPLIQDTAVIENTGLNSGATITYNLFAGTGTIDASTRTLPFTLASTTVNPVVYGNVTLSSVTTLSGTGAISFVGPSNQTIAPAGVTFPQPLTVNKPVDTSLLLGDALTTTGAFTLTQGTLGLNGFDLTCNAFSSSNSNTRSIAFGTKKIIVTGNAATIWNIQIADNFSYTGTSQIDCTYSGSTGTRTINHTTAANSTLVESKALNFNITSGTDIVSTTTVSFATSFNNLNFTGFGGTLNNTILDIYGNLVYSTGMTLSAGTNATRFQKTSGTQNLTTNGKTLDFPVTKQGAGTLQLLDTLTIGSTRTFTLTQGNLDLNGFDLSCGLFNSNNSNTRSIAFGSNRIKLTGVSASGNFTVLNMTDATNFTYTGTPVVELSGNGTIGARLANFGYGSGGTLTNAISMLITAGSDRIDFGSIGQYRDITFTSGFSGSFGDLPTIYGNITLSSGMTSGSTGNQTVIRGEGPVQTITTNGVVINKPITITANSTLQLLDDLTIDVARQVTLTQGTLDINGKTLSCGLFSSSNTNSRSLALGTNGKLTVTAAGVSYTTATSTNFTVSGTGTIDMTSASAKTFAGGGASYPTLNQGGAGTLTITGSNTFANITNTVQPTTITFQAGSTTSVKDFNVSGTAGNLVTLNSSTPGTQWTIAKV